MQFLLLIARSAATKPVISRPGIITMASNKAGGADDDNEIERIHRVVDGWHDAAAAADFDGYFGAMTSDAVFVGTDPTERWGRPAFEAFARPRFEAGKAWTYEPLGERNVMVRGDTAWFDEKLGHATFGEMRGSGVLVRVVCGSSRGASSTAGWKIAHFVLSFPIPNEKVELCLGLLAQD